jgi:hypothetical protein
MKVQNLLFLVLIAGLVTPAAYAQNAGFAVGVQRPIINPPVAPMTHPPVTPMGQPPVQGRMPHFGVTPHIVPPIISTFPPAQFPTQFPGQQFPGRQFPGQQFPNAPTFVGPHRGGPGFGNPGYGGAYGGCGGCGGYGGTYGTPNGGAYESAYGGVYGPTIVVPPNGTVITNSTVIIQQPAGQLVRVGPSTPPVTVTGNGANYQESLVGMTRDQVLQQFGTPISGVYTQSGEMLAFSGGMTVVIQNGKVVRPN